MPSRAVVERVLARPGTASRPSAGRRGRSSGPGLTACFETLNSRQPPVPCASMIFTAACATRWWPKKLSSKLSRSTASSTSPMRPCQARAGIRDDDVDAAEGLDDRVERRAHRCRVGHVAGDRHARRRRSPWPVRARGVESTSSSATSAPAAAKALRGRGADRAAGAGDRRRPGRRAASRAALPSLACSSDQYSTSNMSASRDRLEAADRLGVGDGLDRGFGEVGGDARVLGRCGRARTGRAPAPARRGAADRACCLLPPHARVVALEIGRGTSPTKSSTAACAAALELVELAGLRRRHDQRPVLGADGVVGRHHAGLAVARKLGAVDEVEDRIAAAESRIEALPRALDRLVLQAARAAQDRRDVGDAARSAAAVCAVANTALRPRASRSSAQRHHARSCARRPRAHPRRR